MAGSHFEQLIADYLEWQGFLVRRNVKVGRRQKGGWEMELDIIGFLPKQNRLVHYEPSLDADSWKKREARYAKKFEAGRKYIKTEIFDWLNLECSFEQYAILVSHPIDRHEIAGGKLLSIDEMVKTIKESICACGIMGKNAIPEVFPLLRTIQLTHCGYHSIK